MALMYSKIIEEQINHNTYSGRQGYYKTFEFASVPGITASVKDIHFKTPVANGVYNYSYRITAYSYIKDAGGAITGYNTNVVAAQTGSTTITDGYFRTNIATTAAQILAYSGYTNIRYDILSAYQGESSIVVEIDVQGMEVKDITLDTSITDGNITTTWTSAPQQEYILQVKDGAGTVVYEHQEKNTVTSHTIPARTLWTDNYTISVQTGCRIGIWANAYYPDKNGNYLGAVSERAEKVVSLHRIAPKVIAFEPDGVAQNREQPIAVTWESDNQHGYNLKVKQSGIVVKEYSGTTEKTITIPANTIASGSTALELTLKYIPTWGTEVDAVYASETINFQAYGTPNTPVFTSGPAYSTAYPVIKWTTTEQYYYRIRILSGATLVQDSGLVPSVVGSHTIVDPLPVGSYTVELIIQSEQGLLATASQTATVSFVEPNAPTISAATDEATGTIALSIQANSGTNPTASIELFRKEVNGPWVRIAKGMPLTASYADYGVASETQYTYKARAIGSVGGYKDSVTINKSVAVSYTQISDEADRTNYIELRLEPSKQETAVRGTYLMTASGCNAPRVEYSDEKYGTLECSFFAPIADSKRLVELYYSAAMLLFRDNRGRKMLGCISSPPRIRDGAYGWAAVQFTFTELDHSEAV